ncbi:MAG: VacJ family lipoprotein [Nitrospinota bacterium]|nr:VacJ family lipoprotein [Nitrospinota bacterium]
MWALCFLVLWFLPASAFAAYFPGPPDVLASLEFNPQGEVIFDSQEIPRESPIHVEHSAQVDWSDTGANKDEESQLEDADGNDAEIDPYSDEAVEEDPFADVSAENNGFGEDPFAEEENDVAHMPDPLERWFNRPVYVFNDHFYEYFMRPVAQTYKDILAENVRIMIRNLYNTVTFPVRLASSLLQLKFDKAGRVIGRVLINCTVGFFCMVDVANEEFGIKPVDEDFGQVLGFYGIPSGPYLVLPLLGPSSVRDGVGRTVDALLNPLFWLVPDFTTGAGLTSEQMVNETSFYIDDIKALKEGALDPYISIRDFYNHRRDILVNE